MSANLSLRSFLKIGASICAAPAAQVLKLRPAAASGKLSRVTSGECIAGPGGYAHVENGGLGIGLEFEPENAPRFDSSSLHWHGVFMPLGWTRAQCADALMQLAEQVRFAEGGAKGEAERTPCIANAADCAHLLTDDRGAKFLLTA